MWNALELLFLSRHSSCGEKRYKRNFDASDNCHTWDTLQTFCTFAKEEMSESVKDSSALATESQWWNARQLIQLWPSLSLHGKLGDMSSAAVMQWGYWMALI